MVGLMEDLMVIVLNSRWMDWMEVVVDDVKYFSCGSIDKTKVLKKRERDGQ